MRVLHIRLFKNEDTSTTTIRPVFNCSFKISNSVSLNDAAYVGVNLARDMFNLTLLFRINKNVLLADIRKALLMIRLASDENKYKFCLFLKNNFLKCYRYTTIIFGLSVRTFKLNFIMKYHTGRFPATTAPKSCNPAFIWII